MSYRLELSNTPTAVLQKGVLLRIHDTKQSDPEVQLILEFWKMRCTPSLPSLSDPLWPRVVAPNRVLFIWSNRAVWHLNSVQTNDLRLTELLEIEQSYHLTGSLAQWVECSPMVRERGVQSQVESYQRLKKWYLMPPCLTLGIMKYESMVQWSNPRKEVAPSLHLGVVAIEKGAFWSPSTMVTNFII